LVATIDVWTGMAAGALGAVCALDCSGSAETRQKIPSPSVAVSARPPNAILAFFGAGVFPVFPSVILISVFWPACIKIRNLAANGQASSIHAALQHQSALSGMHGVSREDEIYFMFGSEAATVR
jgi:hypothetical protein